MGRATAAQGNSLPLHPCLQTGVAHREWGERPGLGFQMGAVWKQGQQEGCSRKKMELSEVNPGTGPRDLTFYCWGNRGQRGEGFAPGHRVREGCSGAGFPGLDSSTQL